MLIGTPIFLVGAALAVYFLWPRTVEVCVDLKGIRLDDVSYEGATLIREHSFAVNLTVPSRIKNENYFGIPVKEAGVVAFYNDVNIAEGNVNSFTADPRTETFKTASLSTKQTGQSMQSVVVKFAQDCFRADGSWNVKFGITVTLDLPKEVTFTFDIAEDLPCLPSRSQ